MTSPTYPENKRPPHLMKRTLEGPRVDYRGWQKLADSRPMWMASGGRLCCSSGMGRKSAMHLR